MRPAIRYLMLASLLLPGLAACGSEQQLRPAEGQSLPVKPATASKTPTAAELLEPPPIARPDRMGELLKRSEERKDDSFDLPPPG